MPRPTARAWSIRLAVLVLCGALLVLALGWGLGLESFQRLRLGYAAMVPSTALSFALLAGALLWTRIAVGKVAAHRGPQALAVAVALLAGLDLWVIATGRANGIDQLLWPSIELPAGVSMAPATAGCFLLASIAYFTRHGPSGTAKSRVFVGTATSGLLIALIALVGYAFDTEALYAVSIFTAMALHTAAGFVALTAALLLSRPDLGWVGILLGPGGGSAGARRLFPVILIGPFGLCLLTLFVTEAGLFEADFRLSLLAIVMMALLVAAVLYNAERENAVQRRLDLTIADLQTTIADRDLLLREVYHRVNNNLQQINALLTIESMRLTDSAAKAAFRATAHRVQALGSIHELLMASDNPSQLDIPTFLHRLRDNLATGLGTGHRHIDLMVRTEMRAPLHIETAISLGLLVTELVTNAVKHGFPEQTDAPTDRRAVTIAIGPGSDGTVQLSVADTGVGFRPPDSSELPGQGVGGTIIGSLIRQLDARLHIESAPGRGTTVTIHIPALSDGRETHAARAPAAD